MTAEDATAIRTLVAMASVIEDQVNALGIQVEAFVQQAKALGRRMALDTKSGEAPPAPAQPEKRRHYGPGRTG